MIRARWMSVVGTALLVTGVAQGQTRPDVPGTPAPAASAVRAGVDLEVRTFETGTAKGSYLLATPAGYDASNEYPVIVALPPGLQTEEMARTSLARYVMPDATRRGYVVVAPFAPGEGRTDAIAGILPALLEHVGTVFRVAGGKVHLVGVQSGGRAAFDLAIAAPERVASLTVLPGLPRSPTDEASLAKLRGIKVAMYVGDLDARWKDDVIATHEALTRLGVDSSLSLLNGEGHLLASVSPSMALARIEETRRAIAGVAPEIEIGRVLDQWHAAAANADEALYFSFFADDDSIFMGTDATERWTAKAFREWARPYFERGRAWSFRAVSRHISVSSTGTTAWFDEALETPNLGPCRGSGVLTLTDGAWRIAHYNLSVPIPNGIVDEVVRMIAAESPTGGEGVSGGDAGRDSTERD